MSINDIPENENGIQAFLTLRQFLKKNGWDVEEIQGEYAFKARENENDELCPKTYFFQIKVDLEQFLFYIVPDLTLLPDMLPLVAEFTARANFGMRIGNFEVNYKDYQVYFRSSVNFKGDRLSEALIKGVIEPALEAFDEYFTGLAKIIAGIDTPEAAIYAIEYGE